MVALAPNTSETSPWDILETFPKLHSRAREAITGSCTEAPHSKSRSGIEIWQVVFESREGLESFTRDPIGYKGSEWDLYELFGSNSLVRTDPTGMFFVLQNTQNPVLPCGLKFSWMLPEEIPKPDISGFVKCMKDELLNGTNPREAGRKCGEKFLKNILKDPKEGTLDWLAFSGCCEAYKEKDKFNGGDPCFAGSPFGKPPGTKPQKCWNLGMGIPPGPFPQFPEQCCQFKACVAGVKGILGTKPDPFDYIKCLSEAASANQ